MLTQASSALRKIARSFVNTTTGVFTKSTQGLYYKTWEIFNFLEIDKFRHKLVSSGLDKHTSLPQSTYITNL